MLTKEQVKHIAKLARLGLKDEEIGKFTTQLSGILDYVELLKEVDTAGVELTSQVTGLKSVTRSDVVERFCNKEELLACTQLPVEQDQVKVKPVITN